MGVHALLFYTLLSLREYRSFLLLSFSQGSVSADALDLLAAENEAAKRFDEIAVWRAVDEINAVAKTTGNSMTVTAYFIKGQPKAVFGETLLDGRYFTEEETDVCLLSQNTARALFGNDSVLGLEVCIEEKTFKIGGLLKSRENICVLPETKDDALYDGIAAQKAQDAQSSNAGFAAMESAASNTGGQRMDGELYYRSACLLTAGISAVFLFLLAMKFRKQRIRRTLCLLAAAGIAAAGARFLVMDGDYLPTYWSDFSFWGELFLEKSEQIQKLFSHQEFLAEQKVMRLWACALGIELTAGISELMILLQNVLVEKKSLLN